MIGPHDADGFTGARREWEVGCEEVEFHRSADEFDRPAAPARVPVGSLAEAEAALGQERLDALVCEAVGSYGYLSPRRMANECAEARAAGRAPSLGFEVYGYEGWMHDRAIKLVADGRLLDGWAPAPTGDALLERVCDDLYLEALPDLEQDGRGWREDVSRRLAGLLDGQPSGAGAIDASGLDAAALADELGDAYGMQPVWDEMDNLWDLDIEVSLLVAGDGYGPGGADGADRRAAFEAAHAFLESAMDGGDPEPPEIAPDDERRSPLGWLCRSQGTSLARVLAREGGRFVEQDDFSLSLREAVLEAGPDGGEAYVAVLATMEMGDYLDVLAGTMGGPAAPGMSFGCGEDQPVVMLYDPCAGRAGGPSVSLLRDLELRPGDVTVAMPDWRVREFDGMWTVQECCQMTHLAWETRPGRLPAPAPGPAPLAEAAAAAREAAGQGAGPRARAL